MRQCTPEELRQAVRGRWRWPAQAVTVEGIATDTRACNAGDLFVALRGENFDGHDFLADAAANGCISAIVDWGAPIGEDLLRQFGGGVIGVPDTTAALGDVASQCRQHLAATVVGVTGSNGKTTVKEMIHHILSRRLRGSASPKSFNNAIGVPLTLLAAANDDDYVVCEVGSNAPGEVAALTRIARPDVAVITSVAETHLAGLGDLEHVAMEKAALLGGLEAGGFGVVWADSDDLARAVRGYDCRLIRFGEHDDAELRLTGFEPTPGGARFEINRRQWVELPVPGRHNALNALAAIAVAIRFGFDQAEAAEALADFTGPEMRLQPVAAGTVTILNDAYNANPASLAAAADALASFEGKRRVAVVGDMLELGEASERLHEDSGRRLARAEVELVVTVGELAGRIADGAEAEGVDVARFGDVEEAAKELPKLLTGGDVVLVKGSRATGMERLIDPIKAAFAKPAKKTARKKTSRAASARSRKKKG